MNNKVLCNPSSSDLFSAINAFEDESKTKVHAAASSALRRDLGDAHFVPSLTVHDGYMLGRLYVSSSPDDEDQQFSSIVYVVSPTYGVVVLSQMDDDGLQERLSEELLNVANAASSGGELILGLLQLVVAKVAEHIHAVNLQLEAIQRDVRSSSSLRFGPANNLLSSCDSRTYPAEIEILGVELLILGLERIGSDLSQDKLDLRDSAGWEMFGKDLEVSAGEVALQCQQLRVVSASLIRGLNSVFSEIQRQQNENQRKSNRFVSSIAALFFLPLLMLNFYSQFFAEGEIWSNQWTTDLFWLFIVGVETGAFVFLRARRWLR